MLPRIFKSRKVSFREAQLTFEQSYRSTLPSEWSDFQIRQVAHIIKWASVGFATREYVKLSKGLLVREMGQRGYLKHIHSVFPITQGHNLGNGTLSKYDYRGLLKTLTKWICEQGSQAVEQFKIVLKSVLADIEGSFKKRMGWFWKMVSFWFMARVEVYKTLLSDKVTTIHESSIISNQMSSKIMAERQCHNFAKRNFSAVDRKTSSELVYESSPLELPSHLAV